MLSLVGLFLMLMLMLIVPVRGFLCMCFIYFSCSFLLIDGTMLTEPGFVGVLAVAALTVLIDVLSLFVGCFLFLFFFLPLSLRLYCFCGCC